MHLRTAERLVVGLLAGRHLDQRRAAEEHLGLLLDHHHVVAHPGHVRAAGGASCRTPARRSGRRSARAAVRSRNSCAAGDEDLLLRRQVGAAGLDEVDGRQPVLLAICAARNIFFTVHGLLAPPLHGRVVGDDHALDALDHADAGDHAGADREVRAPRRRAGTARGTRDPSSSSSSMRSRASSLPRVRGAGRRTSRRRRPPPSRARPRARRSSPASPPVDPSLAQRFRRCDVALLTGRSRRVPQQLGGQVVEHLGRSSSDAQDPRVAVVPLHLGPVQVSRAAVQLHGLVADDDAACTADALGDAAPRRAGPRRRRTGRRRRACRSGPRSTRRCISTSRCCTTWLAISGLPNVSRSLAYDTVSASARAAMP